MATTFPAGRSRGEAAAADQDPDQASGVGQAHRADSTRLRCRATRGALLRRPIPRFFRKAWPTAPKLPPELADTDDLLAELAVRGPYASYLRRGDDGALRRRRRLDHRVRRRPGLGPPGRHGRVHRARRPPRHREGRARGRHARARPRRVPRGAQRGPDDVPAQRVGPPRDADVVRARVHEPLGRDPPGAPAACTTASTRC